MPSHDAEGLHLEMTDTCIQSRTANNKDEWSQIKDNGATKRPSNEKLLVRIVKV